MLAPDQGVAQGSQGTRGTRHLTFLLSTVLSPKAARSDIAQDLSGFLQETRAKTQELQCDQK